MRAGLIAEGWCSGAQTDGDSASDGDNVFEDLARLLARALASGAAVAGGVD
ncbi:hypothetical protein ACFQ9X_06790 [Catenulispora yoronensis]